MNTRVNKTFQIKSFLQNAQSVLIALRTEEEDAIASGLSLYLSLKKAGKTVNIVSPDKIKVEVSYLFGVDKIQNNISGDNNLVVSLPYKEGIIEKVSYNIANSKFNLVIEPKKGENLNFDPNKIEYSYGTAEADVIFVIGVEDLENLGSIYTQQKKLFSQKPIINIDKNNRNKRYGRINLVNNMPISQTTAIFIRALSLPLDQDSASNLLTIISKYFSNLNLETTKPEILETTAFLLRFGGKVLKKTPSFSEKKINSKQNTDKVNNLLNNQEKQTPEDWLKPKIFTTNKGSTLF